MEGQFLELRCPNRPRKDSDQECRAMCGGITENLFIHYDFKVPFEDLRYCGKCNGFFKVVIRAAHAIPEFHVLPKGLTLPFVSGLVATIVAGVRKKKCPTQ